jgi:hypothetical protein
MCDYINDILIPTNIYIEILYFLPINDCINMLFLNKNLNNNLEYVKVLKEIIKKKSSNIIFNFMKKTYVKMININTDFFDFLNANNYYTKIYIPLYYFKYYPKNFINTLYRNLYLVLMKSQQKQIDENIFSNSISNIQLLNFNNIKRIDLYYLLKKMNNNDIEYVGW